MLRILHDMRWDARWRGGILAALLLCGVSVANAQWQMQKSGTTASLRGIHAVDETVAWTSGTNGTVLRTTDGGQHWRTCTVPVGADKLDFRAVWAWGADRAIVMSSGPGSQSRLYSTQDGCRTWRQVLANPDADGFWDALQFSGTRFGVVLGDPVDGQFVLYVTYDGGDHWQRQTDPCLRTMEPKLGAFAASNQSLAVLPVDNSKSPPGFEPAHQIWFGTSGGWLYRLRFGLLRLISGSSDGCVHRRVLSAMAGPSAGIFALAFRDPMDAVAVGGDYTKPREGADSAAYTDDGETWHTAAHPPGGYRSTVAWNATDESWIAAGPSGSDVSRDGGKSWQSMDAGSWNAISLPFAVGPHGRIGRLISWGQLRVSNTVPLRRPYFGGKD